MKMGYFDALEAGSFKKMDDGKAAFFPYGSLGRGLLIPTDEEEKRLRRIIRWSCAISVLCGTLVGLLALFVFQALGIYPLIAYLLVTSVMGVSVYGVIVVRVTRGFTPTAVRLRMREALRNSALCFAWPVLILLFLLSLGFVVIGILLLSLNGNYLVALLNIGFFGLCLGVYSYMIVAKNFHGKHPVQPSAPADSPRER